MAIFSEISAVTCGTCKYRHICKYAKSAVKHVESLNDRLLAVEDLITELDNSTKSYLKLTKGENIVPVTVECNFYSDDESTAAEPGLQNN